MVIKHNFILKEKFKMKVKEFKKMDIYKKAKSVKYFDTNGKNISNKPSFILDVLQIIGTGCFADGTIMIDVDYVDDYMD